MDHVAEVALATAVGEKSVYSYLIPPILRDSLECGHLVHVPFAGRDLPGIVLSLGAPLPPYVLMKSIEAILDPQPVVSHTMLELALWVAEEYACPLSDVLASLLPPGLAKRSSYVVTRTSGFDSTSLNSPQRHILDLIPEDTSMPLAQLVRIAGENVHAMQQLVKVGALKRTAVLNKSGAKTMRTVRWSGQLPMERLGAKGQLLLDTLRSYTAPIPMSTLVADIPGAQNALAPLVRRGLVTIDEQRIRRNPVGHRSPTPSLPLDLTAEQQSALDAIVSALQDGRPETFLLYGITGSGKTEIYLQALAATFAHQQQGIILVPEISLTPQTMDRFTARFGEQVALLHSKLSDGERLDEWDRIRTGDANAVVGARSAIFSPLTSPGLIVLDEEHDSSYKQASSPRYQTRDVANKLAQLTKSVVILGSATPDVVTFYRAMTSDIQLLTLRNRASVTPTPTDSDTSRHASGLPIVEVVDLRQELHAGNRSMFSRGLQEAITSALSRQEQVILFLNRRGSASFVICRDCGFVSRCDRCDLPFTYHRYTDDLICHRCDKHAHTPTLCPSCKGWRIRYFGLGTQKVEDETTALFPDARILRLDRDSASGRHGHESTLNEFAQGDADILIGTQMVTKGIDIAKVTVVGVISADTSLNLPDYRASERTFQLLTQVAGRAGRHNLPGRVFIQTYNPEHFAIQAASTHDYDLFYDQEIRFRAESVYPPFTKLLRLVFSHESEEACEREAIRLADRLREALPTLSNGEIVGPAPCFTSKVDHKYLRQILVRADNVHPILPLIPFGWLRDVDPVSLL